jgi:hypothetical protein
MNDRERLAFYPFVVVRIACRLLAQWGLPIGAAGSQIRPDIGLRDLLDCLWRAEAHGKRGVSACGVYLPDLDQPPPRDLPPGLVRLRVVASND